VEEERLECLKAERRSKHNAERSSRPCSPVAPHDKGPMGETSALAAITSRSPARGAGSTATPHEYNLH
jgi:hypothetical protein